MDKKRLKTAVAGKEVKLEDLTEADIGRWVKYDPGHCKPEWGRIKSWNDSVIFVVYNCGGEWDNYRDYTAAGTNERDLIFDNPPFDAAAGEMNRH